MERGLGVVLCGDRLAARRGVFNRSRGLRRPASCSPCRPRPVHAFSRGESCRLLEGVLPPRRWRAVSSVAGDVAAFRERKGPSSVPAGVLQRLRCGLQGVIVNL